ncbi:MAG TPA: hypothetical protein IAC04_08260 [Candidatus Coprenecus stercoravium]|uniref:Uncharacterized protein n=1 Tax=Candidatus Coprenecus stercoravium TaxID=2840735 RepID=A0A9D2GSL1_9BACT|nr:hypothetical protein [Candidatus Coprenecus stercoravium]
MNILVSPYRGGDFYFRSDSTLIRMLSDFYFPDYVDSISAIPMLCMRSGRSGKSVSARFAPRYLGDFSCGLLLKASVNAALTHETDRTFIENALDYSTIIPYDLIPVDRLSGYLTAERPYTLKINGLTKAAISSLPDIQMLSARFEAVSRYCSVRTGDFIAFELSDPIPVSKDSHLTATFGVEGHISVLIH